jgi:hypothetical protein
MSTHVAIQMFAFVPSSSSGALYVDLVLLIAKRAHRDKAADTYTEYIIGTNQSLGSHHSNTLGAG